MRKSWKEAEKKDAKLFETTLQPYSGRMDHYPSDSTSDFLAVDTKHTSRKSYSISIATWTKLCNETASLNDKDNGKRIPLLSLHIAEKHLVVLDVEDYKLISDKAWRYEECST